MADYTYVNAEITGESPFLMMAIDPYALLNPNVTTKRDKMAKVVPREVARSYLYVEESTKKLTFPTTSVARLLREAGSSMKLRGERKAVKWKVPAAVVPMEENMYFRHPETKKFLHDPEDWEVDVRSAVNAKTQGRIAVCRPRIDQWTLQVRLRINEDVLSEDIIHKLLQDGGEQIGLGAFRPEKGGRFGLFRVTSWQKE